MMNAYVNMKNNEHAIQKQKKQRLKKSVRSLEKSNSKPNTPKRSSIKVTDDQNKENKQNKNKENKRVSHQKRKRISEEVERRTRSRLRYSRRLHNLN